MLVPNLPGFRPIIVTTYSQHISYQSTAEVSFISVKYMTLNMFLMMQCAILRSFRSRRTLIDGMFMPIVGIGTVRLRMPASGV